MKKTFTLLLCAVLLFSVGPAVFAADAPGFLWGDIDRNGEVQAADARLALRASVGLETIKPKTNTFAAADVNHDGRIGSDDARSILRASVGLDELSGSNELEYLRNGCFYLQGTLTDSYEEALPLEMAVTPDSVYMLSTFEGAQMGMLVKGNTTYMLYPEKKAYLELDAAVLAAMGMDPSDLMSADSLSDYSMLSPDNADDVLTEEVNGVSCQVYVFNNNSGSTRYYLNGDKLVRFATFDETGKPDSINNVSYITDRVPADKLDPPADYTKYTGLSGMFSFIALLDDTVSG